MRALPLMRPRVRDSARWHVQGATRLDGKAAPSRQPTAVPDKCAVTGYAIVPTVDLTGQ
ncbi:hypothetical protein GCM10018963_13480 [Saccharothrix longispora]